MTDLLAALARAEQENVHSRKCLACEAIQSPAVSDEERPVLRRALSGGTIGVKKLADVLAAHGLDVGRRAIIRHREEAHGQSAEQTPGSKRTSDSAELPPGGDL